MTVIPVKNMGDPRVKRTRKLLIDALDSLLSEQSFDSISVQDIAERATVNRATFYAHYRDKTDLIVASARERVRESLMAGIPVSSPLTADTLRSICVTIFELLDHAYGTCQLGRQMGPLLESTLHEELSTFIGGWLQANAMSRGLDHARLDLTAQTISSAMIGSAVKWLGGDRKQPARQVADHIVALLAPGLLALWQSPAQGKA